MAVRKRKGKGGTTYYQIRFQVQGNRIERATGPGITLAQAKEYEAKIRRELMDGRLGLKPDRSLSDGLYEWTEHYLPRLSGQQRLMSHARKLFPYIEGRGFDQAPQAAEEATRDWLKMGLKPTTINRRLAILRRICNLAFERWEWLDHPVGDRIQLLSEEASKRDVFLDPQEVRAIADSCRRKDVRAGILVMALTGMRRSSMFRFDPERHVQGRFVTFPRSESKTGKPIKVPMRPEVDGMLEHFPLKLAGSTFWTHWNGARKRAGLAHVWIHDLRHTYASWLINNGAPLELLQDILGHSRIETTRRYVHLYTSRHEQAVGSLDLGGLFGEEE